MSGSCAIDQPAHRPWSHGFGISAGHVARRRSGAGIFSAAAEARRCRSPNAVPKIPRSESRCDGPAARQYGGTLRTIIGSQKDIRLMTINGYARLVGYDEQLNMQPDILESFDVADDRVFTFKIRKHKWSDGSLLTPEDFRYCWEDVWLNDELSQGGSPRPCWRTAAATLRIVDPLTVRYSWDAPNPASCPSSLLLRRYRLFCRPPISSSSTRNTRIHSGSPA